MAEDDSLLGHQGPITSEDVLFIVALTSILGPDRTLGLLIEDGVVDSWHHLESDAWQQALAKAQREDY